MFELERVIAMVPADAWDRPTPCPDWTLREVAGHAMGVTRNIAARARGVVPGDVFDDPGSIAGEDPLESMRAIRIAYLEATDQRGALGRQVQSRVGDMTVDAYLAFMRSDTFVHSWDIARGAAVEFRFDPNLVAVVMDDYLARDMTSLRVPGRYESALPAGGGSALDALVAFTGRDPLWTAA